MTAITATDYQARTTEDQMEQTIRGVVGNRGLVFHIRDSRGAPEMVGFPDLVIVLPEKSTVLFVELKSQKRRVTPDQRIVIWALEQCSEVRAYVVRPEPKTGEISFDQLLEVLR